VTSAAQVGEQLGEEGYPQSSCASLALSLLVCKMGTACLPELLVQLNLFPAEGGFLPSGVTRQL
jgi:hypothetical protein